jgi:hypothetical protein
MTAMLSTLKKNLDGSLAIYMLKDSPSGDKESNWLPARVAPSTWRCGSAGPRILRYSVEAAGGAAHQVTSRRGSRHEACGKGPHTVHDPALRRAGRAGR